jgi:hypothetical protein
MNDIPRSAFDDLRTTQVDINLVYGEWIPTGSFEYTDGEWTIDGMEPFEWAEAMFGEDSC